MQPVQPYGLVDFVLSRMRKTGSRKRSTFSRFDFWIGVASQKLYPFIVPAVDHVAHNNAKPLSCKEGTFCVFMPFLLFKLHQ